MCRRGRATGRRGRARAAAAVAATLLAAAAAWCLCPTAFAATAARERAALTMLSFVGGPGPALPPSPPPPAEAPTPDVVMVMEAWRSAGVRVGADQADHAHLQQRCAAGRIDDRGTPGPDPEPGDYLLYDSAWSGPLISAAQPRRVALFVSPVEVVYWNDREARVERAMAAQLLPGYRPADSAPGVVARNGTAELCRLAPSAWPDGEDARGGWHVALADPGFIAEQHQWAAAHPRDADTSPLHPVALALLSVVSSVSQLFAGVAIAAQGAGEWLLRRMGVTGSVVLTVLGLLGTEFDGRRLHRFLTGLLLLPVLPLDPRAAPIAFGLLAGHSPAELHLARAGAFTRLLVGGAGFTVDVLTGVEDSRQVRVGLVLFAVASDLLVFGKVATAGRLALSAARSATPLLRLLPPGARLAGSRALAGGRLVARPLRPLLGPLLPKLCAARSAAGRGSVRLLEGAGDAGDVISLRPSALARVLRPRAVAEAGRAPTALAGDVISWTWRGSSAGRDLIGHLGHAATRVDEGLQAGTPPAALRYLAGRRAPVARLFPRTASGVAGFTRSRALPATVGATRLVHLNSEAHAAARLLAGQSLALPPAPGPPPPLQLGLAAEVRRAAELRARLRTPAR